MRIPFPFLLTLLGLLAAYALLPWAVHTTTALTGNAYDLAEWMSIHPAVRAEPLMLTPLLLRLPLVCVAWWVVLQSEAHVGAGYIPPVRRQVPPLPRIIIVVLIAIALLPPFEFLTSAPGDPNYQQQAMLAALALIGGLALVWLRGARAHHEAPLRVIQALIPLVGAGAGVWGTIRALGYWDGLSLTVGVGAGLIVFVILALIAAWLALRHPTEA
ncbi:MAG: hypothetical protein IT320_07530 [Anaerolineae bacterium]|nr:hypothetical protein [Anaerolineae bacterium]